MTAPGKQQGSVYDHSPPCCHGGVSVSVTPIAFKIRVWPQLLNMCCMVQVWV